MSVLVEQLMGRDAIEEVRTFINKNPTLLNKEFSGGKGGGLYHGTLLHYSCLWNQPKVVLYLLSQNADVTKCFKDFDEKGNSQEILLGKYDGLTAQQIAEKCGYVDITNLFELFKREKAAREAAGTESKLVVREDAGTEKINEFLHQLGFDDTVIQKIERYGVRKIEDFTYFGKEDWDTLALPSFQKNKIINKISQPVVNIPLAQLNLAPTSSTTPTKSRAETRHEAPTFRIQPGRRFLELIPKAPIDQKSVVDCLRTWATTRKLDTFIIDDMEGKIEDFKILGHSPTKSLSLSMCWLYTTDSWVYKEINLLLREDLTSIRVLAPFMNGLIKSYNQLGNEGNLFCGTVYRRAKLDDSGLEFYKPNMQFIWSSFTSTSMIFNPSSDIFGDTLFVITVPEEFKMYALNLESVSPYKSEKEVLLLPNMGYIVKEIRQGPFREFPNTTLVIYLVVAYVCLT